MLELGARRRRFLRIRAVVARLALRMPLALLTTTPALAEAATR
jgi:hypothetical protein